MNVLIITSVGGFLPKFLMQDVHMLIARGHKVHYASNFNNPIYECDREQLESDGIHCHLISIAKSPASVVANTKALKQLIRIVKEEQIDVVYLHNPMGGVLGRLLTFWKKDLYVIYTAHGFHFYQGASRRNWMFFYPVEKFLARRTNQIITINQEDRKLAKSFHLRENGVVSQIPGIGLDVRRFCENLDKREVFREKFGVKPQEFVFLSVGELNDNKNHATIIRAFSKLKEEEAKLFICGEGPNHQKLESLITELKLEKRVILWGYQTEIEEFYQAVDCFVFPSVREGLGMAAIEAMACGLPLIVSDNRGSREYAKDNAIVCDTFSVDEFTDAMRLLLKDRDICHRMAERSIAIAKAFTKEETMLVLEEVFAGLENQDEA